MTFEVYGTKGAVKWNFERMNELQVYLPDEELGHDGFVTIFGWPDHPLHGRFNPGPGIGLGYDDLKTSEAFHFLKSIVDGADRARFRRGLCCGAHEPGDDPLVGERRVGAGAA
jgi:hypothetical protein